MKEDKSKISVQQINDIIDLLNPSMDDYLYIYDFRNDLYSISANAMERFAIPDKQFSHVEEVLHGLVHPEDFAAVQEDLVLVQRGEKEFHNLQYRWLDKAGNPIWINCRGRVVNDSESKPEFLVGCINEIGMKQKADNVSGLLGETSFQQEVKAHNYDQMNGFVMRLGIDNFKDINENKGVDYGNMILRETAACIESAIFLNQKLYKIVADEFIVLDFSGRNVEDAQQLYSLICQRINKFIEEKYYEVFYTISAGILDLTTVNNRTYFNIMKLSEFALSEAKNNGKNKAYTYCKDDYMEFLHRKRLIQIMRQSVYQGFQGFQVYYQPIVDLKENRMFSAEALLRFELADGTMLSPVEFIPLLEESGLIIPVGKWVMEQAMKACMIIRKKIPDFRMSVNLSYVQVLKSNVLEEILTIFRKYELTPGSLMVELTESGFLEANDNFLQFCAGLKNNGILLALDDFGTGYSNFHYLYNLSPDALKIDRSFTQKALNNECEYNLLQHMVEMTHSIHLKICIEGIETQKELQQISGMEPDFIQGFFFGRPCSLEHFLELYTV